MTFSKVLPPTINDLILKRWEGTLEPSASTYVCVPRKSSDEIVFERIKVSTTSAGMLTSLARLIHLSDGHF